MLTGGLFPLGFSYEKDTRLYFDDTCVVPERLEGKQPAKGRRGQAPHPGVPTQEPPSVTAVPWPGHTLGAEHDPLSRG